MYLSIFFLYYVLCFEICGFEVVELLMPIFNRQIIKDIHQSWTDLGKMTTHIV